MENGTVQRKNRNFLSLILIDKNILLYIPMCSIRQMISYPDVFHQTNDFIVEINHSSTDLIPENYKEMETSHKRAVT